jgi:general secretion pathway protein C
MTARWTAFGLWAAVAASVVYWGLKLFVPGTPAPVHAAVASLATPPRGDLSRLLGVDAAPDVAPPPQASARFHLIGVVAPRAEGAAREGLALIAVDDKPPRAYRVGALIDGDTVLQAVHARGVALGPRGGAANFTLDIPPPAPAATGALPTFGGAAPPPVAAPFVRPARPLPSPSATMRAPQLQQQQLQQQQQQNQEVQPDPGRNVGLLPTQ